MFRLRHVGQQGNQHFLKVGKHSLYSCGLKYSIHHIGWNATDENIFFSFLLIFFVFFLFAYLSIDTVYYAVKDLRKNVCKNAEDQQGSHLYHF